MRAIPDSERTEMRTARVSKGDIEKAVEILERSLSFQNAEVSRMKTRIKIIERTIGGQRRLVERLKRYLEE